MQSAPGTDKAIEVRTVTSLDALEEHAEAWDRLVAASPENMPNLSHACVASFLETQNSRGWPWRCLFAYRGEELVGVLPVLRARGPLRHRLVGPADSHMSRHPVLAPAHSRDALRALVGSLSKAEPRLWMRFSDVREGSPFLEALPALAPRMRVYTRVQRMGSMLDTTGPYEEYLAGLSKNFKGNVRSARNKANRDYGLTFESITGDEAAEPYLLEDFLRVEGSGWKAKEGTAIVSDPARVEYFKGVTRRLAERGWLEWNMAKFGDKAVATYLSVRQGRAIVLWKIAYDESYSKYKPGVVLMNEVIARAFGDESLDEVNFMSDEPWMHVWHPQQAEYSDVVISPRRPLTNLSAKVEAAAIPRRVYDRYLKDRPELRQRARTVAKSLRLTS